MQNIKTVYKTLKTISADGAANIINLLILSYLLKHLSPIAYSHYATAQTVNLWLNPLTQLGMLLGAPSLITEKSKIRAIEVIQRTKTLWALAIALILAAIYSALLDGALQLMLMAFLPLLVANSMQYDFAAVYLGRPETTPLVRSMGLLIAVSAIYIILYSKLNVELIPIALSTGATAALLVHRNILQLTASSKDYCAKHDLSSLDVIRRGLPIALAGFVQLAYLNVDVLFLTFFTAESKDIIGQYTTASILLKAATMPIVALLYSSTPSYIAAHVSRNPSALRKAERSMLLLAIVIGAIGTIAMAFVAPPLLSYIGGRELPLAAKTLKVFAITYFIIALGLPFYSTLPLVTRSNLFLYINIFVFTVSVFVNVVFTPIFKTSAAAYSTILSAILCSCSGFYFTYKKKKQFEQ